MEESEQAKKKQRQIVRKAAVVAAAENAKANKVGSVKTRMVNSDQSSKLKNSGDEVFEVILKLEKMKNLEYLKFMIC